MFTKKIDKLNKSVVNIISKLDKLIIKKNKEIIKLKLENAYLKKGEYDKLEQKLDGQHTTQKIMKPLKNSYIQFDVRNFFQKYDKYPTFEGTTKEIVEQVLNYVKRIKIIDKTNSGYNTFPFMSYETIQLQQGTETDVQILIANLLLASGVPYYKVRLGCNVKSSVQYIAMYYTNKWITVKPSKLIYSFNKKYVY